MAIYRLLQQGAFDDRTVKVMATAYEASLQELGLTDRKDPITEMVATKIIEIARLGERDPVRLRELALKDLRR